MPVNTAQQFTVSGTYGDRSSRDLTALVAWNSSAAAVATIGTNGVAVGVSAGTATISATLGSVTGSTTLTITAPTITAITITPDGLTLGIGINLQYTATATYSDGSTQDLASGVSWSSSSSSVVSINSAGLATTVGAGQATITETVGSVSDTSTLTVVPAHLVSIAVTPQTSSIEQGTAQQFTAVGAFDDDSTQLLTSVAWSSSATNVASINSAGLATGTGTGTGTATIAAVSGSVTGTASLTVTVAQLVSIAMTPANSSMAVGTSKQFTATGTFSDNSTQDITASVLWSSSNPGECHNQQSGIGDQPCHRNNCHHGTLGAVSGSTNLTVSSVHLIAIVISPSNPRIAKKTLIKFTETETFSDGSTATNLSGLTWKSSKPNIASIRQSGLANGKKTGTVTISASSSGVTGTTTLTIGSGTLVSIAITPVNPSVTLGSMQQFTATGSFDDGTSQDITNTTHWSSSSASVATIANAPRVARLATTWGVGTTGIGGNSGG
jgi:hypothetical protein